jgi:hypothetical protein
VTGRPSAAPAGPARRAAALLRWYPAAWRARYGAEFAEFLAADLADQPRSWRRTADIARCGLTARLAGLGLAPSGLPDQAGRLRASLATHGCALGLFLTVGAAMLAQLGIGWSWTDPHAAGTAAGTLIMCAAGGALLLLAAAAAVPAAGRVVGSVIRRQQPAWPAATAVACAAVLAVGAHHFQNSWPGTGGADLRAALVPAGVAAFGWAATSWVSAFWMHPVTLHALPAVQLAWMAVSPVLLAGFGFATAAVVRRAQFPPRLAAYEARLARAAVAAAGAFLAGAACWVLPPARTGLFHAGMVDVAGLAVMGAALAVAARAAGQARAAVRA